MSKQAVKFGITATAPINKKLAEPARLRLFEEDEPIVKKTAEVTGMNMDEIKRRGLHLGMPVLIQALGIDPTLVLPKAKAA